MAAKFSKMLPRSKLGAARFPALSTGSGGAARRRLISIGHLLSGNFINAGIMLVSVAIAARALGPAEYGIMVLVLAFGRTIERLIRFESWQPLIRFAASEGEQPDPTRLAQLYAYGLLLDLSAASLAAMVTFGASYFLGPVIGISPEHIDLVGIYSIALLLNVTGMSTAVLRLTGRFRTIAYGQLLPNILRVGLALACYWQGAGLYGFVAVWTFAQISGTMVSLFFSLRMLKQLNIPNPFFVSLSGVRQNFPGFLGFAWSTNLSTMLRTLTHEADALLVGALAGPSGAGFYYLAKRIAKVAQQVGAQVQTVIYPDVARMWAKGDIRLFRKTTLEVQFLLGAVGVGLLVMAWLFGEWLIMVGPGPAYLAAVPLLLTQLVAVIFTMHAAPSRSALLSMGRPGLVLAIAFLGSIIFFVTALLAIPRLGPMGANLGHIGLAAVTALLMDVAWLRGSRARSPVAAGEPSPA
jgi:O-antigen/teichoic acid export membrane protein